MEIPIQGKKYKYSNWGKYVSIGTLVSSLLILTLIALDTFYVKNSSNANLTTFIVFAIILFWGVFFIDFICPYTVITNSNFLYVKSLFGGIREIPWHNIKKFIRKYYYFRFSAKINTGKRSALIVTANEGILRKFIILPPYFIEFEELLDNIEHSLSKILPIEKTDSFYIYPIWLRNISIVFGIAITIFFWIPTFFLFTVFLKYKEFSNLIVFLPFLFLAILITIAVRSSLFETFCSIIIDKNALILKPGKILGRTIGKEKILDFASFDFYLYYNTDNSNKIFYRKFFVKNKKGKICFKLRADVDLFDKLFEQLRLNNTNIFLKEITEPWYDKLMPY